jgi:hypothetical protein
MIAGRMTTPIIKVLRTAVGLTEEAARKEDKKISRYPGPEGSALGYPWEGFIFP